MRKMRTKLEIIIDSHARKIWGYVRMNQNSLDSERANKIIRKGLEEAVQDARLLLDEAASQITSLQEQNREMRKALKKLTQDNEAQARVIQP